MRGQRVALAVFLVLGAGLGVLIAGIPDVSPEMSTSVDAGPLALTSTTEVPEADPGEAATSTLPLSPPSGAEEGREGGDGDEADDDADGADEEPAQVRPPEQLTLVVLNGARIEGAASELTSDLEGLGYQALTPDNTDERDRTVVAHREGSRAEAVELAAAIHESVPTEPLTPDHGLEGVDGIDEAQLVVLLGADYEAIAEEREASEAADGGEGAANDEGAAGGEGADGGAGEDQEPAR